MLFQEALAVVACCLVAYVTSQMPLGRPPSFQILENKETWDFNNANVLTEDREMLAEVTPGNISSYTYLHGTFGALTIIIRPCTSSINVTIHHISPQSNTGLLAVKDSLQGRSDSLVDRASGMQPHVFSRTEAPAGLYLFDLVAQRRHTMVTMYATSLPSVPPALRIVQDPRVRVQPRLHRNRVTLRWDQSFIDPQAMHYCVAVNSKRNFTSLCQAKFADGMNVHATVVRASSRGTPNWRKHGNQEKHLGMNDVMITCVGSKLSYTISNLQKGREYYFNIFAQNRETHLSFLYANKYLKYESRVRPLGLRDNKPVTINIRRFGGKVLFRYKIPATSPRHPVPSTATSVAPTTMRTVNSYPSQVVRSTTYPATPPPRPRAKCGPSAGRSFRKFMFETA